MIKQFLQRAKELNVNIDSIVVEEKGLMKAELIKDIKLHELRSCSKLLVAFAYGVALNEKFRCKQTDEVLSLDTKIYPTLKNVYCGEMPKQVEEWTIRTLLTHSTGYEKMMLNERHLETIGKENVFKVLFDTNIKYGTGEHFTYSNVEPYLLSVFFQENFDISIAEFVKERIFKPLGIKDFEWSSIDKYCAGATGLKLNYNDFHKIGQLLMYKGKYQGQQIVPESWIEAMTSKQVECPDYYKPERVLPKLSAGYFVWLSRDGVLFRDGSNGQYIICDHNNNRLITIMSTQKDMALVTECLRGLI